VEAERINLQSQDRGRAERPADLERVKKETEENMKQTKGKGIANKEVKGQNRREERTKQTMAEERIKKERKMKRKKNETS
jgi:hypothetical protein